MKPLLMLALLNGTLAANFCCSRSSIKNVVEPSKRPESLAPAKNLAVSSASSTLKKSIIPDEEKVDVYEGSLVVEEKADTDEGPIIYGPGTNILQISINTPNELAEPNLSDGLQSTAEEKKPLIGEDLLSKSAILPIKPHDYHVQVAECKTEVIGLERLAEFNKHLLVLKDPAFFEEFLLPLFAALYPGLKQVPILESDVIGLALFALIVDRNNHELVASELNLLLPHFSSELLSRFALHFEEYDYTEEALKSLLEHALKFDCFYTVEAFMAHNKDISFSPDGKAIEFIVKYAQMGSSCLIEKHLSAELKDELQRRLGVDALLPYLVSKNCKSCKLVESPVWSGEEIEAGALASIDASNWVMFKCFMAQNKHSYNFLHPKVVDCCRIIYSDRKDAFELFQQEIKRMKKGVSALVQLMLKLASPEPIALAAFEYLIKNKIATYEAFKMTNFDPLSEALFLEELGYLKLVCDHPSVNFVKRSRKMGAFGIWEIIRGAQRQEEIMRIIVNSPHYQIYHALANPDLNTQYWPDLLKSILPADPSIPMKPLDATFEDLVENFGFSEELLTPDDRFALKLRGKKTWSLMHLAVLALNIPAAEALIANGFYELDSSLDPHESKTCTGKAASLFTPLKLAQGMLKRLNGSVHLMPQVMERASLRSLLRESHPAFYSSPIEEEVDHELQARERCKLIINLLTNGTK